MNVDVDIDDDTECVPPSAETVEGVDCDNEQEHRLHDDNSATG